MIRIITDTTASMTLDEYQKNSIQAVPLYVTQGEQSYQELYQLSYADFYKMQRSGLRFSTSQPSPQDFLEVFRPALDNGDEIICVLISSGISGTVNSAALAAQMLETDRITVFDSHQSGFNQAALALKAHEWAESGLSRLEIIKNLEQMRERTRVYYIVESLRYLYEGGRLNGAQALIGSVIQIKPIVWFDENGIMTSFEKIRTLKNAKNRVLELVSEAANTKGIETIGLHYGDNYQEAKEFGAQIEAIAGAPVQLVQLSPVISSHTGPDILGACFVMKP